MMVAKPGKVIVSAALPVAPDGLMGKAPKASGSDEAWSSPQTPDPFSGMDWVPPAALSVTFRVPELGTSPDDGVNVTVIVQAASGASVAGARGQLSPALKSPPAATELRASGAVPVFVSVTS